MLTHGNSSDASHGLRASLSAAADLADRRLAEAAHASERAHRQVQHALHKGSSPGWSGLTERRWRGRMEPLVGQLSAKAQQLARHGADLASDAGHRAQESWQRYSDATTGYVSRQPMRSVLIAAAVGAGVALLLAASRKRR